MQTKQEPVDSVNTCLDQGCKPNKSMLTVWTLF